MDGQHQELVEHESKRSGGCDKRQKSLWFEVPRTVPRDGCDLT